MESQQKRSKRSRIGLIILLILIIAAVALIILNPFEDLSRFIPGGQESTEDATGTTEISVRIQTASRQDIRNYIKLNGDVVSSETVDVYSDVTGKITALQVEVGDVVEEDDIIAQVDPSRPGMVYRETAVTSPVKGTVLSVNYSLGSTISVQAPLIRIGMLGSPEVEVAIAERHIGTIGIGSEAVIRFVAYPGRDFQGNVVRMAPVLNPATRTLTVGIKIEDPDMLVKTGMFPSVHLYTELVEDALVILRESILYEGGQAYVYTVDDNQVVHKNQVTIGMVVDEKAQILEGLSEGDVVVIQGQTLLTEGTVVRVVD